MKRNILLSIIILALSTLVCKAQKTAIDQVAALYAETEVDANIEYSKVGSQSLNLDLYVPAHRLGGPPWNVYSDDKKPVLLYFHGGGFTSGDKISRSLFLMPYISKGWCVATADMRLLGNKNVTLPDMIADARAALNWVYDNADKYKFDTGKIIVSGESAGGYLALMTGLMANDPQLREKAGKIDRPIKIAGIINWFGAIDITQIIPKNDPESLKLVTGPTNNPDSILRVCDPVKYISASSPPIFTIHGEQDKVVPYIQAQTLQSKLNDVKVKHELFTVTGKHHGDFDAKEMTAIYIKLWKFLDDIGVKSPYPAGRY